LGAFENHNQAGHLLLVEEAQWVISQKTHLFHLLYSEILVIMFLLD